MSQRIEWHENDHQNRWIYLNKKSITPRKALVKRALWEKIFSSIFKTRFIFIPYSRAYGKCRINPIWGISEVYPAVIRNWIFSFSCNSLSFLENEAEKIVLYKSKRKKNVFGCLGNVYVHMYILWHINPLLGNNRETDETNVIGRQQLRK
jgi:hypothetical protein